MEAHASSPFVGTPANGTASFSSNSKPVLDAGSSWDSASVPQSFRASQMGSRDRLRLFSGSANQVYVRQASGNAPACVEAQCVVTKLQLPTVIALHLGLHIAS